MKEEHCSPSYVTAVNGEKGGQLQILILVTHYFTTKNKTGPPSYPKRLHILLCFYLLFVYKGVLQVI